MKTNRKKETFTNASGHQLAALMELPQESEPHAFALFAHCFTCSKDVAAASRISRGLARMGFGVLRFDFTGLGNSDGDFANTNFSSNVADLKSACDHLREHYRAPSMLMGHSLGGAAVLAAAQEVPEAKAVVTIGAPASPNHVRHHFSSKEETILREGEAEVTLAGRHFKIKKQFLEDIEAHSLEEAVRSMKKALLVFHAPLDDTVSVKEAATIYAAAKHPKSFVSLDGADHLLTQRRDAEYVADVISAWVKRYLND